MDMREVIAEGDLGWYCNENQRLRRNEKTS